MAGEGKIRVERFNDANFRFWKMHIEDYLYQKDLYLSLGGKAQKLKEMTDDDPWHRRLHSTSPGRRPDSMVALLKMYEKPSASNKVFLMKKFNLNMAGNESVAEISMNSTR